MIRQYFLQTLLVFVAFALMVASSYLYVKKIEHENLESKVDNILFYTQNSIETDLKEPRTTLAGLSQTVRAMILFGCSGENLDDYFKEISDVILYKDNFMNGFAGIYGYFEAFDGMVTNGRKWPLPEGYDATTRPWYKKAAEANGEIVITQPYKSAETGSYVVAYVRRIFDDFGKPLGSISLSIDFNRIGDYIIKTNFGNSGYGVLLDSDLKIIVHPDSMLIGTSLRDSSFANDLKEGKVISEYEMLNYKNEQSVVFFRKLVNDWHFGIVTPKSEYTKNAKNIIKYLSALGLFFATLLSFLLFRTSRAYITKVHEVEYSKQTIGKLENVLNEINAMIYVTVPETGELLFVNSSMKKHYNFQGNPVGKICYEVFQKGKNQKCEFCPCFQLDKDPSKAFRWEEHCELTKRVYQNTDRYIEWPNGQIVHLQSSIDITDLINAKEQAILANQIKSKFLAFMSHEIRTPMNTILGITEIQLQDETLPQSLKEAFHEIYNSGDLLLGVINDILDLSKIEADKMDLSIAEYEVASLINDVVHLNLINNSKPIEFDIEIAENTPSRLLGDGLRIKQILNNLLSNAFKYTDEGTIKLSVNYEEIQKNTVMLTFQVSDTGHGLTKGQMERLFEEYTRFSVEAGRHIEGVGLGLSITRRLVNMMNGRIVVESEYGEGSSFTVHLPQGIADFGVIGKELAENLRNFRITGKKQMKKSQILREPMPYGKVLIVDDVKSNLYVAKGLMLPYGLSIDTVLSGYEAVEKIKHGNVYDIIFMDHMMPGMDGITTTKFLRELGYAHTIVALTANAVVGQTEEFIKNGFDDFISKPIDIRHLNNILNKYIHDKQPPEIIEMARSKNTVPTQWNPAFDKDPSLLEYLLLDIKDALAIIEYISKEIDEVVNKNMPLYTIKVHAMKSALANMGDAATSKLAQTLEKAGRERDVTTIKKETESLIIKLRDAMSEVETKKQIAETSANEDAELLRRQLEIICNACSNYNEQSVLEALNVLKKSLWKKETKAVLDKISENILFSNFEEAGALAAELKKSLA